jgi:hypothetical protein
MFNTTVPAPDLINRMFAPEITEFTFIVFALFAKCRNPDVDVNVPPEMNVDTDPKFSGDAVPALVACAEMVTLFTPIAVIVASSGMPEPVTDIPTARLVVVTLVSTLLANVVSAVRAIGVELEV